MASSAKARTPRADAIDPGLGSAGEAAGRRARALLRRRQCVVASLLLGGGLVGVPGPRESRAERTGDCGYPGVRITYADPTELDAACKALENVVDYFRAGGFEVIPRISVDFVDGSIGQSPGQRSTHGYFDAPQSQIVVFRSADIEPWGMPWNARWAISFLQHELVHMAVWQIAKGRGTQLRREWHEFIAYALQFDLMDPALRADLLARHTPVQAFEHLTHVNEFVYQMGPELFAVAAYKTYLAQGAAGFVGRLLRAEIVPPTLSHP